MTPEFGSQLTMSDRNTPNYPDITEFNKQQIADSDSKVTSIIQTSLHPNFISNNLDYPKLIKIIFKWNQINYHIKHWTQTPVLIVSKINVLHCTVGWSLDIGNFFNFNFDMQHHTKVAFIYQK